MIIKKASEITHKPTLNFLVYGDPKIGKSTFAIKGGKVLIADCESGYRFMGMNGLDGDIAEIQKFSDMRDVYDIASKGEYELIVIDPVNELLEKLMEDTRKIAGMCQSDKISLTMKGWGYVKTTIKRMLKGFRDLNINVLIIAHTKEEDFDGITKKSPRFDANLSKDLMGMMDVIGYMRLATIDGEKQRIVTFESSETYEAGDRTSILPKYINADMGFSGLYELISKNKKYNSTTEKVEIKTPLKLNSEKEEVDDTDVIEKDIQKESEIKEDESIDEEQKSLQKQVYIKNIIIKNNPKTKTSKEIKDFILKNIKLDYVDENFDLIIEKLNKKYAK